MGKPCLGRCPQGVGLTKAGKSEARPAKCPQAEIHCCKKRPLPRVSHRPFLSHHSIKQASTKGLRRVARHCTLSWEFTVQSLPLRTLLALHEPGDKCGIAWNDGRNSEEGPSTRLGRGGGTGEEHCIEKKHVFLCSKTAEVQEPGAELSSSPCSYTCYPQLCYLSLLLRSSHILCRAALRIK